MEKSPVLSRVMVMAGIAKSMGRLPGEVALGAGLSSIKCTAMFSKCTWNVQKAVVRFYSKVLYFSTMLALNET